MILTKIVIQFRHHVSLWWHGGTRRRARVVDQAQSARSAQNLRCGSSSNSVLSTSSFLAHHPVVVPHVFLKSAGKVNDARQLLVPLIGGSTQMGPEPGGAKDK